MTGSYSETLFGNGFFAAIYVTANNVVLNLGNNRLEQSVEHSLHQPSFALVALTDGVHNFTLISGILGRSAQIGLKATAVDVLTIANVTFTDFAGPAIALADARTVSVKNVRVGRSTRSAFVNDLYLAGINIRPFVLSVNQTCPGRNLTVAGRNVNVSSILQDLDVALNVTFEAIVNSRAQIPLFMALPAGLPGNGIDGITISGNTTGVSLVNVDIFDISARPTEAIAIQGDGGAAQLDATGVRFRYDLASTENGAFAANPVAVAQLLVRASTSCIASSLSTAKMTLSADLLDWAAASPPKALGLLRICGVDALGRPVQASACPCPRVLGTPPILREN